MQQLDIHKAVSYSYSKTVLLLCWYVTNQLPNYNYRGSYMPAYARVALAKLVFFINGCGLTYKL